MKSIFELKKEKFFLSQEYSDECVYLTSLQFSIPNPNLKF